MESIDIKVVPYQVPESDHELEIALDLLRQVLPYIETAGYKENEYDARQLSYKIQQFI